MKNLVLMVPQMRHGGAERAVSRLTEVLNKEHNITVVVFDDSVTTYELNAPMISLDIKPEENSNVIKKAFNVFRRIKAYSRFKKENNIDVTYSFGDTANIINILTPGRETKIVSIRGFRRIRTKNGIKNKFLYRPLSKYIIKKSDKVVTVSNLITETIKKEYDIEGANIVTSYNGYDIESILELSKEKMELNDYDMTTDRLIVTAGTFRLEKGYWHLVKALSLVVKVNPDVKLLILGENTSNNKERLIKLAKELGVENNILYGGYQSNPYKYFSKADLYVLPSIFEGFPNALVEAMACKLPVIAADCKSGPREILAPNTDIFQSAEGIEENEYGILVSRMSIEENYDANIIDKCEKDLANAILMLIDNSVKRKEYSGRSYLRAKEFSYKAWRDNQNAIINS